MISKFLELKENSKDFIEKMNYIFWLTFFLRLVLSLILVISAQRFFSIYKIEYTEINQLAFYFLGLEYVIAGMILSYGLVLRLESKTIKVFKASLIRFVVEISLIYLLLFNYGILAAAVILLISRYVETLVTYFFIRNQGIFHFSGIILLCFFVITAYSLLQMLAIFK